MEKNTDSSFSIWAVREVDHLFSRFARYTRFVFVSKWFLGVFAILLMVSLIAYPLLSKDHSGIRVSFIGSSTGGGNSVASPVMNNPQYQGSDDKGQEYKVTGARAIQKTADLIQIEDVEGQLLHANGSAVSLHADRAEYQQDKKMITLIGNVTITDASGYVFSTPQVTINTANMDVDSDAQVDATGPQGNLLATGFKMRDNGNQMMFGSAGTRVTVRLDKMRADKK